VGAQDGALVFETSAPDSAIVCSLSNLKAAKCPYIIIRMKIDAVAADNEMGQLFWTTPTAGTNEPASMKWKLIGDGQYHDYIVHLAENTLWRGRITTFRLDPCSHAGAKVAIEEIRMSVDGK